MTYEELYDRACKKGKLRKDEYSTEEFIEDVNELGLQLWTTIFQGVNGNKPNKTRSETVAIAGDLNYVHTRTIEKTPIQKIILDGCSEIKQKTDLVELYSACTSFEYDDEEVRFNQSVDGSYEIFYEAGTFTPLTTVTYAAGASPDWLKDDFISIFWQYVAFINSDTVKADMLELYKFTRQEFEAYYSRTETIEENCMKAEDSEDQL